MGNTFDEGFFWTEIIDAAADVYNGVRSAIQDCSTILTIDLVCLLDNRDRSTGPRLV